MFQIHQLVSNIRKYKGANSQTIQNTPVTIRNTSDWNNSNIINYNHYTGGKISSIDSNLIKNVILNAK